jgi:hypothetical protein
MANPSTFLGYNGASYTSAGVLVGTGRGQLLKQTLAAVTETELRVGTDDGNGAIAVLTMPSGTTVGGAVAPLDFSDNAALINRTGRTWSQPHSAGQPAHNSQSFDFGRPFLVRVCGTVTPASDAANTWNLILYYGATKSGTSLAATGALTGMETSTQAGSFILEAQLQWDSVGQRLGGQYWYQVIGGTTENYNTWKATSYVSSATLANLKFCASITWGAAAGGVVQASEFSVSQL